MHINTLNIYHNIRKESKKIMKRKKIESLLEKKKENDEPSKEKELRKF